MTGIGPGRRRLLTIAAVVCVLVVVASRSEEVRWRVEVVTLQSLGKIPDLRWADVYPMLKPGSGFWLAPLASSRNPYAVIHSPYSSVSAIRTGRALFHWRCEQCHGPAGVGASAPALVERGLRHGSSDWALFRTIRYGVDSTAMAPHDYPPADLWKLVAYIQSLETTHLSEPPSGLENVEPLSVKFDDLRRSDSAAADWPTYYGSYNGHRYSQLSDINRHNIAQLQARWIYQIPVHGDRVQATPIAASGRLFVSTPEGGVVALNGDTGELLWRYSRALDGDVALCCVTANRGVAVLDGTLFVVTLDAHLIALDGTSGAVLWDKVIADYRKGYSSTGAPLVVKGMVVTGIAGSEYGASGFVTAYDARDGRQLWRFETIPQPGEKGNETWAGDSWRTGGVSAWMTGTYDPELDLIYWGTGNAAPDYDSNARAGDNLYSDSVVALRADTGKLAWYFQFSPGDDHDWDAVQTPVLADVMDGKQPRKLLITANRNGFFYALDRTDGRFLWAKAYVKQTWAERIDSQGRPVRRPEAASSPRGSLVYPGTSGATNWWPPSYSPKAQLFFVPALERPGIFFRSTSGERHEEGEKLLGGSSAGTAGSHFTAVRALDPLTGGLKWEYRSAARHTNGELSGLLSTAGDLVFTSDLTRLVALDTASGQPLWSFEGGGTIYAPPVSYRAAGEQFIAFAAGDVIVGAALPRRLPAPAITTQRQTARR